MAISNAVQTRRVAATSERSLVVPTLAAVALFGAAATLAVVGLGLKVGPPVPADLPACSVAEQPVEHGGYQDWPKTLVDPGHTLAADYRPPDLQRGVVGGQEVRLRSFVFGPLQEMVSAAESDGVSLVITSSYRSYASQQQLFDDNPGKDDLIARPGHSEHQLGTTVDLSGGDEWLAANAARFGFALSYPDDRSPEFTCYSNEPWHYRYFGPERARQIASSGLSPREWLWREDR